MQRDELAAWLRLAYSPGLGNASARQLLAAFDLPQNLWRQPLSALAQVVGQTKALALQHEPENLSAQVDSTTQWLAQAPEHLERRVLTLADPDYPQALLNIADPPLLLFAQGRCFDWPRYALAVVGSRNPSAQGEANALAFASALGGHGISIVSGLALGIDGAAHRGALQGAPQHLALATIAVVGTGLDRVYPKQHLDLAHTIAERGLLLSEFPLGTPPLAANFPKRNRLIAGLSQGTLVVEAALRSGSLITARLAAEQGKEVFAVPGSIHAPHARGCHALIKQGAKLVEAAEDVLEELRWPALTRATHNTSASKAQRGPSSAAQEPAQSAQATTSAASPSTDAQAQILQALGFDPVGLDALAARTGCDAATLQAHLLELELAGQAARLPGGLFQRLVRA